MRKNIEEIRRKQNCEKITKKELETLLKKYNKILSKPIIEYLNSLLNCEISAVASNISIKEKEALCDLYVYRAIAMYNIYNRSYNLLKSNSDFNLEKIEERFATANIYANNGNVTAQILSFQHLEDAQHIGFVNLFLTKWDQDLREKEFARLFTEYERLSQQQNPYHDDEDCYGGPASSWYFRKNEKLKNLEEKLKELDSRKELSDAQKMKIEIQKFCFDLLLKDMGLKLNDFTSEQLSLKDILKVNSTDSMEKKLVKKLPGLTVSANIKHL